MRQRNRACLLAIVCFASLSWAGVPDWLKLTARQGLPAYKPETDAVVLLDETTTTVDSAGEVHTVYRKAYKVLRANAVASLSGIAVSYSEETQLTYLKGWAISAVGVEYEVKEKDAVERDTDEITDRRTKELDIPGVDVGGVVGFEYQQRGHPQLNEQIWHVQRTLPVVLSRYVLRLPAGWTYEVFWNNHDKVEPKKNGSDLIWELANVAEIEIEDSMPAWNAVAARMLIHFYRENDPQGKPSWSSKAAWYSKAVSGRRGSTSEMQRAVKELTAGSKSTLESVEILASWVQKNIRYLAVEIGIGRYQPHFAGDVYRDRYGDCKDKVTLLSAMLKEIGVESDYLLVHSVRGVVRSDSPSAASFDHVILAIHLPKDVAIDKLPARYEHPQLGTLLFFDPTSELTPFGLLPESLQQGKGLLVGNGTGELIELPLLASATNGFQRQGKFTLLDNGSLSGQVEEKSTGAMGTRYRAALKQLDHDDQRKLVEIVLGSNVSGYDLTKTELGSLDELSKPFEIRYSFNATGYAKRAGGLVLVRPRVLGLKASTVLEGDKRHYPVEFSALTNQSDTFEIAIPTDLEVDELPEPMNLVYDFGEYHSKVERSGNALTYTRQFTLKQLIIPTSRLDDLKKFFQQIAVDEKHTAVLKPKVTAGN